MTWINDQLNTGLTQQFNTATTGNIFDISFAKGLELADAVTLATDTISAYTIAPEDLSGITLTQISPNTVTLTLPTEPTAATITAPSVSSAASAPALTTDAVATDVILASLIGTAKTNLEYRLTNATGLAAAVETALIERATDRETKIQAESYNNYLANQSSTGFDSAPGQDANAFITFETQKKAKLSDLGRDIFIKQAELEQSNVKDALVQLIQLESSLAGMKISDEQNKVGLYRAKDEVLINHINAFNKINEIYLDLYRAELQGYATTGQLTESKAEFLIKQIDGVNALNSNNTKLALDKVQVMNQYTLGKYNALTEGQKAVGATLGQLTSTIMNTLNFSSSTSVSTSFSGSESIST